MRNKVLVVRHIQLAEGKKEEGMRRRDEAKEAGVILMQIPNLGTFKTSD